MLRQIWAITRNELKLAAQAPAQWALVVLTPIVFIAVMGAVFGATGAPTVAVYLVDEDGGRMSRQIISALRDEPTLAHRPPDTPRRGGCAGRGDGERMAAIVLPAGLSEAVLTRAGGQIEVIVDPAREQTAGIVIGQVQAATAPMLIDAEVTRGVKTAFATPPDNLGLDAADLADAGIDMATVEKFLTAAIKGVVASQVQDAIDDPLVRIDPQPATDDAPRQAPTIFDYLVPGYSVFFAFFLMGMMAETVLNERLSGTLRRLFSLPLGRTSYLLGKTIPYSLMAMLQVVIVFGASALLFAYDLGSDLPALALMIVATGLAIGGVSILVAVLIRTEGQANSIPTLITLVTAAISGAMFPSIRVPALEVFTPQYWAIQGFLKLTALGGALEDVLLNIGVLVGMGLLGLVIATWRFRYN
jgi:ABC-2 type transport system permease protein